MGQQEFDHLLRFFKALANESRLKILGILATRECSVEELATLLSLKEPTVSHHLTKLKELGLVRMQADGNTHLYQLDGEQLQALNKDVFTPEQMASLVDDMAYDTWERKVLNNFLADGRLTGIPASRKKRVVILKWLVNQFDPGRKYPEAEVNDLIARYHPDYATIRREFIGHKLMARKNGLYWRL